MTRNEWERELRKDQEMTPVQSQGAPDSIIYDIYAEMVSERWDGNCQDMEIYRTAAENNIGSATASAELPHRPLAVSVPPREHNLLFPVVRALTLSP